MSAVTFFSGKSRLTLFSARMVCAGIERSASPVARITIGRMRNASVNPTERVLWPNWN